MTPIQREEILRRPKKTYHNTAIGGLQNAISTKQEFLDLMGLADNEVEDFTITNFDIRCNILRTYTISQHQFRNQSGHSDDWGFGAALTYYIDKDNLISYINFFGFYQQYNLEIFVSNNITGVNRRSFRSSPIFELRIERLVETVSDTCFADIDADFWLPRLTDISGAGLDGVFSQINPPASIYIKNAMLTSNNGNPEPDLQQAIDNGVPVTGIVNEYKPDKITDLSIVSNSVGEVTINFTAANSSNGIQRYLLYLDDGSMFSKYKWVREFTGSSVTLNGLPNGSYSAWVIPEDIYRNRPELNVTKEFGYMTGSVRSLNVM